MAKSNPFKGAHKGSGPKPKHSSPGSFSMKAPVAGKTGAAGKPGLGPTMKPASTCKTSHNPPVKSNKLGSGGSPLGKGK